MSISPSAHDPSILTTLQDLIHSATFLASRSWLPATSGSVSARLDDPDDPSTPLSISITVSGTDKGSLTPRDFLTLTDTDNTFQTLLDPKSSSEALFQGHQKPSGETLVHHVIYAHIPQARSVLHTHSVHNTLCSNLPAPNTHLSLSHLEMLKALGHWDMHTPLRIPTVPNHASIPALANAIQHVLDPQVPGVLVQGHGLYTWGPDIARARRHVEAFEFLFEHEIFRRLLTRSDDA